MIKTTSKEIQKYLEDNNVFDKGMPRWRRATYVVKILHKNGFKIITQGTPVKKETQAPELFCKTVDYDKLFDKKEVAGVLDKARTVTTKGTSVDITYSFTHAELVNFIKTVA